jgi:hypothetical protein
MRMLENAEKLNGTGEDALWSFRTNFITIQRTERVEVEIVHTFSILVEEGIKVEILKNIPVAVGTGKVERIVRELEEFSKVIRSRRLLLTPVPISPINPPPRGSV